MAENTAELLLKEWEQFKSENDRRLKEIEKTGRGDPLTEEKINKHSEAIGALQKELDELAKKSQRVNAQPDEKAAYKGEFETFIRKGQRGELLQKAATAGTVGTDATAGYAVPEDFDTALGQIERNLNPMRGVCNVIRTRNENYVKLFNMGGADAGWVGETDTRGQTSVPSLEKLTPVFGEVYANIYATQKLLDDSSFDIANWIASEVSLTFASEENTKFTTGDGTKAPKGILAYTLAETADDSRTFGQLEKLTTASATAIASDELIDLQGKAKAGYRANGTWMMRASTVTAIRKIKGTQNDHYMWQPSLQIGQPAQLLGHPIVENEAMDAVAAGKNVIMFGDFKRAYTIADVGTYVTLRDPYTVTPYIRFYFARRVGGFLADSNAVKVLVTKAA